MGFILASNLPVYMVEE